MGWSRPENCYLLSIVSAELAPLHHSFDFLPSFLFLRSVFPPLFFCAVFGQNLGWVPAAAQWFLASFCLACFPFVWVAPGQINKRKMPVKATMAKATLKRQWERIPRFSTTCQFFSLTRFPGFFSFQREKLPWNWRAKLASLFFPALEIRTVFGHWIVLPSGLGKKETTSRFGRVVSAKAISPLTSSYSPSLLFFPFSAFFSAAIFSSFQPPRNSFAPLIMFEGTWCSQDRWWEVEHLEHWSAGTRWNTGTSKWPRNEQGCERAKDDEDEEAPARSCNAKWQPPPPQREMEEKRNGCPLTPPSIFGRVPRSHIFLEVYSYERSIAFTLLWARDLAKLVSIGREKRASIKALSVVGSIHTNSNRCHGVRLTVMDVISLWK